MKADSALRPVDDSIWLAEGEPVDFFGFPYPTRSVVVRLHDGGLWIWSPVRLTTALRGAVDALGPVRHLVAPNKLHHLFLEQWQAAYPGVLLWGPRSLQRKRGDLAFRKALTDRPPAEWGGEIGQAWFRGSPLLDEIVFFHHPSGTAVVGDLSENLEPAFLELYWRPWQRLLARWWKITAPWGYAPLEWRLSWWDRAPARAALEQVLAWQPRRVIIAHGRCAMEDGTDYLQRAFAWLRRKA